MVLTLQDALQKTTRGATSARNASLSRLVMVQFALTLVLMSFGGVLLSTAASVGAEVSGS